MLIGRYVPQLSFLEVLLGDEPVLSPEQIFYQRLLAMDQDEARYVAEAQLQNKSLESLYETVLIPALRLAEEDRHSDVLGERTSEFIAQTTRELIDDLGDRAVQRDSPEEASGGGFSSDRRLGGTAIVCVPARDEADELVGMMFAQILRQAGYGASYLPIGTVNDMLEQVQMGDFRIAYVSALPPFAVGQARSLCKRLRERFPELVIVIGLWKFAGGVPKAQERVGASCANAVATTFSEGLLQVARLSHLDTADILEKSKTVGDDDKDSKTGSLQNEAAV